MINVYKITQKLPADESALGVVGVPPIGGSQMSAGDYFDYMIKHYAKYRRILAPSVVGCALSHLGILKRIVADNTPGIVFEDDILVTAKGLCRAKTICAKARSDFVHLGWHPSVARNVYFQGKKTDIEGLYKVNTCLDFHGAFAYFISPSLAAHVVTRQEILLCEADLWREFLENREADAYFAGIFAHPEQRGNIWADRERVPRNSILHLARLKAGRLMRAGLNRTNSLLRAERPIKPDSAKRGIKGRAKRHPEV